MRNGELFVIYQKLNGIGNEITEAIPVRVGWKLLKNVEAVTAALNPYIQMHNLLVVQYADGEDTVSISNPRYAEFTKKLEELNNQEVKVDIETIDYTEIEDLAMPLKALDALSFMISR